MSTIEHVLYQTRFKVEHFVEAKILLYNELLEKPVLLSVYESSDVFTCWSKGFKGHASMIFAIYSIFSLFIIVLQDLMCEGFFLPTSAHISLEVCKIFHVQSVVFIHITSFISF